MDVLVNFQLLLSALEVLSRRMCCGGLMVFCGTSRAKELIFQASPLQLAWDNHYLLLRIYQCLFCRNLWFPFKLFLALSIAVFAFFWGCFIGIGGLACFLEISCSFKQFNSSAFEVDRL
ncbi:hypothetical protein V6N13_013538 [Hibiscus sabdariffa]